MTRARIAAALAALLTALLLQATLIAPLALSIPVSLPALLVAAVALHDGPGAGMAFGFTAGLVADLASVHPAGVLALTWLLLGLCCGRMSTGGMPSVRRDVVIAAVAAAVATAAATLALSALDAKGAPAWSAVRQFVPSVLIDAALALLVVPLVRMFLGARSLRAPHPLPTQLGPPAARHAGAAATARPRALR
jgi:rod shape-determining protein MreD